MKISEIIKCLEEINESNHNKLTVTQEAALLYLSQKLEDILNLMNVSQRLSKNDVESVIIERHQEGIRHLLCAVSRISSTVELGPISGLTVHRDRQVNKKVL